MEREKCVARSHDGDYDYGDVDGHHEVVGERYDHDFLLGSKLRRGITLGKKGGLCTPVPSWKFEAGPSGEAGRAMGGAAISARKLGANLWEIQDLMPVSGTSRRAKHHHEDRGFELQDPGSERAHERTPSAGSLRRHSTTSLIQRNKAARRNDRTLQLASPGRYSSSAEIAIFNEDDASPTSSLDLKERLRASGCDAKTSTDLLKVVNRIWSLEDKNASNISSMNVLKLELVKARTRIQQLLKEQRADRQEIDNLLKQVVEDKFIWKSQERGRVKAAVQSIKDELEDERKLRRHSESLHRSLAKELCQVKSSYSKALKDLGKQRKESALLEELCDAFAEGIGDYEQQVRQLKQKHEKGFSPVCDNLLLHISEAWLDERMQVKLAESLGNFRERDSIIQRLGCEVEAFLQARQPKDPGYDVDVVVQRDAREAAAYLRRHSLESLYLNGAVSAPQDAEDGDSIASDLHCFGLDKEDAEEPVGAAEMFEEARISNSSRRKTGGYPEKILGHTPPSIREFEEKDNVWSNRKFSNNECDGIQDAREGGDRRSRWDHGDSSSSTKQQLDSKIHPEGSGGDNSSGRIRSRGKSSIAGTSYNFPDARFYASSSAPHRHLLPPVETEITESPLPLPLPPGVKENTLKAKLLEARLEGQQARRRMPRGLLVG